MPSTEVVITGMGLVSPLGLNVRENWENFKAQKTGIRHFPTGNRPAFAQYLGKVNGFKAPADIPGKLASQIRFLSQASLFGLGAAQEALMHAAPDLNHIPPSRRALYLASGDLSQVGYAFLYPAIVESTAGKFDHVDPERLNEATLARVNPFFLLESIANNLFSFLSAYLTFMGTNTTVASLSPCGAHALELAARSIQDGHADIAMAVACSSWVNEIPLLEMTGLGLLSRCRHGVASFRPLDRRRDGFIPGEGAAALVLESAACAHRRGAPILASLRGFGNATATNSTDSWSVPDRVSEHSMRAAIEEAGCDLLGLAFWCPHASGTVKGDRSELNSIMAITSDHAQTAQVTALKAYTAHLGAASDLAEIIFGVQALTCQMVPGTLNFQEADAEFAPLTLAAHHQPTSKCLFLSTSYGLLGQSSSVVVGVP
jgi:3-oxoacyl-[acyl-carrier-protein] synthase II